MTAEQRTERHVLKPSDPFYNLIRSFCHDAKNLYNHANHDIRQEFFRTQTKLKYETVDKIMKSDKAFPDYASMPTAQSAQQVLRMLDKNWKSYFKAHADWKKHPEKYSGEPRIPKYLDKNGHYILVMTNQNCRLKDGVIHFPKVFSGFTAVPRFISGPRVTSFQQVRFLPKYKCIVMELVYNIEIPDEIPANGRYIGIDIGVNNLAAVANTWGDRPFVMNGRPLKSMNQFANKKAAAYKSVLDIRNRKYSSKKLSGLMSKRTDKIDDYMHKASRYIVDYCVRNDVSMIVIGRNKNWKQGCNPCWKKKTRQNFVQIPMARFINMIQYKAKEHGIAVITTEESYTSGTSYLDDELPTKAFYNKSRRVHRGLFKAGNGQYINADINGAYQIMKKVVPIKWDRGCVLHPAIITIA